MSSEADFNQLFAGGVVTLDGYQAEVLRTIPENADKQRRLACFGLGVTGEAGEVADLIKKHVGHGHELDADKLRLELGDVLWYVAALAHLTNTSLSEIAEMNLKKLEARYPNGFSTEASIARKDVQK